MAATNNSRIKTISTLALAAAYLASAFFLPEYWRYLLLIMSIMAIVVQGLNVMIGFAGIFSFGQTGFMVFGAYLGAILATRFPWLPFPVVMLVVALASAFLGVLIGFPCLRLRGFYLAMATFGFTSTLYHLITYFEPLTGGSQGMYAPAPSLGSLKLGETKYVLLLAALCVIAVQVIVRRIDQSRTGRAWKAIRDDEIAASSMGINLASEKLKAFAFGAVLAGIAGLLYSYTIKYLEVGYFSVMDISILLMMVAGGTGRVWGPLYGTAFMTLLPQLLGGKFNQQMSLVYGVILIGFVLVAPRGFYGIFHDLRKSIVENRERRKA
jgi:branched-chain amino acid transport system permease protein